MARRVPARYNPDSPQAGASNPNYRGGRVLASNGYVLVLRPGHPEADTRGYVYEHRLVAAEHLARPLEPGEVVHHRNHDKTDNRWKNLKVIARRLHGVEHRRRGDLRTPGEGNPTTLCACGCGSTFPRYDPTNRPRQYVSGHNLHRSK